MPLASAVAAAPLALVGVNVLAMDGGPPRLDQTVLVADGDIAALGPRATLPPPRHARVVEAHGAWLLPGLVDAHVHVFDPADLPVYLSAGVTSVVNMAGTPAHLAWRDEVARGARTGPRLYTAGPLLDTLDDEVFGLYARADTPERASAAVRDTAALGYDFAKVHGDLGMPSYDAVLRTARLLDLPVVGHLSPGVGLAHAMAAGQATVEHAEEYVNTFFDADLDPVRIPEAVRLTRNGGATVTPTLVAMEVLAASLSDDVDLLAADPALSPLERVLGDRSHNLYRRRLPPAMGPWYSDSLRFQEALVDALAEGSVPLLAGTDCGWLPLMVPGRSLHRELELLVDSGLTPADALAAATVAPGRFLGEPIGMVRPGYRADLLLLAEDPRVDLDALAHPLGVVAAGRWYDPAGLARLARPPSTPDLDALVDALRRDDPDAIVAAVAREGVSPETAQRVAIWLAQAGRGDELAAVLRVSAGVHPESWLALSLAGHIERLRGDPRRAVALLRRAAATAPASVARVLDADARAG